MPCKNDDGWPEGGSFTEIGQCVTWDKLVAVRLSWNRVWELLKKEERAPEYRYGWGSPSGNKYSPDGWKTGCKNRREEIESLADIRGYISIRLDYWGNVDAVAFVIDGGSILNRLSYQGVACSSQSCGGCQGQESKYAYTDNRGMGRWGAHLKDPCHGCTIFTLDAKCDVRKEDIVYQTVILDVIEDYYKKGPNTACPINRHWQWLYNPSSMPVMEGMPNICGIEFDWRSSQGIQIFKSALDLFPVKMKCADEQDPYTTIIENCCGVNAIAHWTEEWDPADQGSAYYQCPEDEIIPGAFAPGNIRRFCKRRIKYIDLYNGFYGHVTQIIRAKHLNHIWGMVQGLSKTLRECKQEKCEYKHGAEKKNTWVYKDQVPQVGKKETLQQRNAGSNCDYCELPKVGQPICSCEWDDLKHLLDAELTGVSCLDEWRVKAGTKRPGDGPPYLRYGEPDSAPTECSQCIGKCCYNCKCEGMTENDCMNIEELKLKDLKEELKAGPVWLGVYGQTNGNYIDTKCTGCDKRGDPLPCNGWEEGDTHDPDMYLFEICGAKSACHSMKKEIDLETLKEIGDFICMDKGDECKSGECECCCMDATKCQCDAMEGTWVVPDIEQLKQGKQPGCSTLCEDPNTCTEKMCEGTWELVGGSGNSLGGGKYCDKCYKGLKKWYWGSCEDKSPTTYELKKTQCGQTTVVETWTSSCDDPKKIEPDSSGLCDKAEDGEDEPQCQCGDDGCISGSASGSGSGTDTSSGCVDSKSATTTPAEYDGVYTCTGSVDDNGEMSWGGGSYSSPSSTDTGPCYGAHSFSFTANLKKGSTVTCMAGSWGGDVGCTITCCGTAAP
jgi:hypothetical protein